jgi:hypothetical protein
MFYVFVFCFLGPEESKKHRRLLKKAGKLSIEDLLELAHLRGMQAQVPDAQADAAHGPEAAAGEAAPPAAARAAEVEHADEERGGDDPAALEEGRLAVGVDALPEAAPGRLHDVDAEI